MNVTKNNKAPPSAASPGRCRAPGLLLKAENAHFIINKCCFMSSLGQIDCFMSKLIVFKSIWAKIMSQIWKIPVLIV